MIKINKNLIDYQYLNDLTSRFYFHEKWINNRCPINSKPVNPIKEYFLLSKQNIRAYDYYRHKLHYFIRHVKNSSNHMDELLLLFEKNIKVRNSEMQYVFFYFNSLDTFERFRNQFQNTIQIFNSFENETITHEKIFLYQQKYEIEFFLIVMLQLRNIYIKGTYDHNLNRFRDRKGKLKKGVMADFITGGLKDFPALEAICKKAYDPKIRNIVGHNEYYLQNETIYSLDKSITLTREDFLESLYALQELQNAILWLIMTYLSNQKISEFAKCGVVSIGYVPIEKGKIPEIVLYQIWPFFELSLKTDWLKMITLTKKSKNILTSILDTIYKVFAGNSLYKINTCLWEESTFLGDLDGNIRDGLKIIR